ncbi:hypothetical protein DFH09DRAFT_1313423 [Mycena vulgaris]|nr:hypothetical protein DFH09DRAFT_1313423 [Mycena vulgaris]
MATIRAFPPVPAELELEIFETTAFVHPQLIPALILVARRFHQLLEPFLYRRLHFTHPGVVTFHNDQVVSGRLRRLDYMDDPLTRFLASRPPAFFASHVRHLRLEPIFPGGGRELVWETLPVFTGITDLQLPFFVPPDLLPMLEPLRLERLSLRGLGLFAPTTQIPFGRPFFQHLTRLHIMDRAHEWFQWSALTQIPHLSQLSFDHVTSIVCQAALQECKSLRILVVLLTMDTPPIHPVPRDVRFVMMRLDNYVADWDLGVRGAADYWARAAGMVQQNKDMYVSSHGPHPQHIV